MAFKDYFAGFRILKKCSKNSHCNYDAFLVRLNAGSGIAEWITHFGGDGDDGFYDVFSDGSDVYVAGYAESSNSSNTCSVPGGTQIALCDAGASSYFQSTKGGGSTKDAFVARFNSNGDLTYSTYMGANQPDFANAIGLDANDKLVIVGKTGGGSIPSSVTSPCGVPGAGEFPLCDLGGSAYYQSGNPCGFIIRLDNTLQLEWGTFFGQSSLSSVTDLAFNTSNDLVIVGQQTILFATTNTCSAPGSNSFPVCAAGAEYKETYAADSIDRINTYIARFDASGELTWSTPYGEWSNNTGLPSIAIDDDDNMYMLSSITHDPQNAPNGLFPGQYFPGYYQQWEVQNPSLYDQDATLVAFDVNNERQWATVFGADTASSNNDWDRADGGKAIATYASEDLLISGMAASVNLYQACPIVGTSYCQAELSDLTDDAFVTLFNIEWLVTQMEEIKSSQEPISIYPNPVNEVLHVQLSDELANTDVSVMSIDGRIVWSQKSMGNSGLLNVPTARLSPGVYVLYIDNNGQTSTAKFIKR